jgi:hypothetical protein
MDRPYCNEVKIMDEKHSGKRGRLRYKESIRFLIAAVAIVCFLMPYAATPAAAETFTVTSRTDSGAGSLRSGINWAFLPGDVITFDPAVFPPANPATIPLLSALPDIAMDGLTIDASNAGVILDGSNTPQGTSGLRITSGARDNVI